MVALPSPQIAPLAARDTRGLRDRLVVRKSTAENRGRSESGVAPTATLIASRRVHSLEPLSSATVLTLIMGCACAALAASIAIIPATSATKMPRRPATARSVPRLMMLLSRMRLRGTGAARLVVNSNRSAIPSTRPHVNEKTLAEACYGVQNFLTRFYTSGRPTFPRCSGSSTVLTSGIEFEAAQSRAFPNSTQAPATPTRLRYPDSARASSAAMIAPI